MAQIEVRTTTNGRSHSLNLYYHWQGPADAPVIAWLAGLGQDHLAWGLQLSVFSKKFRCLLVDNRDVGRSGRVEEQYSAADMAADFNGLLEVLQIPRVTVVGLSLGGVIAQEFALNHPERLEKLVLLSTFGGGDPWVSSLTTSWAKMYSRMPVDEFMRAVNPWVFTWRCFKHRPAFLETLVKRRAANLNGPDEAAFSRQCLVSANHNTLDRLPLITAPTLVQVGEEDIVTPPRLSRQLAQLIPEASLEIIPGSGHGGSAETPEPFNRGMLAFFESQAGNPPGVSF